MGRRKRKVVAAMKSTMPKKMGRPRKIDYDFEVMRSYTPPLNKFADGDRMFEIAKGPTAEEKIFNNGVHRRMVGGFYRHYIDETHLEISQGVLHEQGFNEAYQAFKDGIKLKLGETQIGLDSELTKSYYPDFLKIVKGKYRGMFHEIGFNHGYEIAMKDSKSNKMREQAE